jgi:tetratricopeptide (TPR) repeat protein
VALLAVTAWLYAPVREHAFLQFDDSDYVTENPLVLGGLTSAATGQAFSTFYAGNWHPLTWISHMADVERCGLDAGCHLTFNVFLHASASLLLLIALFRATRQFWPALFVAALFAWHPLHVESVAWVAERKDVLHGFWWMGTFACHVEFVRRGRPRAWYLAVIVCAGLAFLSKPMAVTLPFVLILVDIWPLGRWNPGGDAGATARLRTLVIEKAPLFLMTAGVALATWRAQGAAGAIQAVESFPWALRAANAATAYLVYLGKTIWPANLAALYPYPDAIPAWHWMAAIGVFCLASWLAWRARRARPYVLVGWLMFAGMLVPVIGLVQVGAQPYADRYMYLPAIGLFIIGAWGMAEMAARRRAERAAAVVAVMMLAGCAALAWRQVPVWRDSVTLWTHATRVTPRNYRAYTNLGFAHARAQSSRAALAAYDEALRIAPGFAQALSYRGSLYADLGDAARAEADLRAAIAARPRHVEAHNTLGLVLASRNRLDEAIASFRTAVTLQPGFGQAWNNLGIALAMSGRLPEALDAFRESVRLQPSSGEAHLNLGTALADSGRPAEARPHLERAIALGPADVTTRARAILAR